MAGGDGEWLIWEILPYVTARRFEAVFSKVGAPSEANAEAILDAFVDDVVGDFRADDADHAAAWDGLSGSDQSNLCARIREEAGYVLEEYL